MSDFMCLSKSVTCHLHELWTKNKCKKIYNRIPIFRLPHFGTSFQSMSYMECISASSWFLSCDSILYTCYINVQFQNAVCNLVFYLWVLIQLRMNEHSKIEENHHIREKIKNLLSDKTENKHLLSHYAITYKSWEISYIVLNWSLTLSGHLVNVNLYHNQHPTYTVPDRNYSSMSDRPRYIHYLNNIGKFHS